MAFSFIGQVSKLIEKLSTFC